MKKLKLFLLISSVIIAFIFIFKSVIGDFFLKKSGACIKGVLVNKTVRTKGHKPDLLYEFKYEDKIFDGNSLTYDISKIGDSVCVIFLKKIPFVNRPIEYFNPSQVPCDCK